MVSPAIGIYIAVHDIDGIIMQLRYINNIMFMMLLLSEQNNKITLSKILSIIGQKKN